MTEEANTIIIQKEDPTVKLLGQYLQNHPGQGGIIPAREDFIGGYISSVVLVHQTLNKNDPGLLPYLIFNNVEADNIAVADDVPEDKIAAAIEFFKRLYELMSQEKQSSVKTLPDFVAEANSIQNEFTLSNMEQQVSLAGACANIMFHSRDGTVITNAFKRVDLTPQQYEEQLREIVGANEAVPVDSSPLYDITRRVLNL